MKKILLTCLVALTVLAMASCNKDVDLSGTTWRVSHVEEGDTTAYELVFAGNMTGTLSSYETYTSYEGIEVDTDTTYFTYTFDGKADGTMSATEEDGTVSTTTFMYDKDDDVLRLRAGVYELIFTKWDLLPE